MFRFVVAAAIIGALLAYAKAEHVLDRAGIVGSCAATDRDRTAGPPVVGVPARRADGLSGSLEGRLHRGILRGEVRYWLCPAPLVRRGEPADD